MMSNNSSQNLEIIAFGYNLRDYSCEIDIEFSKKQIKKKVRFQIINEVSKKHLCIGFEILLNEIPYQVVVESQKIEEDLQSINQQENSSFRPRKLIYPDFSLTFNEQTFHFCRINKEQNFDNHLKNNVVIKLVHAWKIYRYQGAEIRYLNDSSSDFFELTITDNKVKYIRAFQKHILIEDLDLEIIVYAATAIINGEPLLIYTFPIDILDKIYRGSDKNIMKTIELDGFLISLPSLPIIDNGNNRFDYLKMETHIKQGNALVILLKNPPLFENKTNECFNYIDDIGILEDIYDIEEKNYNFLAPSPESKMENQRVASVFGNEISNGVETNKETYTSDKFKTVWDKQEEEAEYEYENARYNDELRKYSLENNELEPSYLNTFTKNYIPLYFSSNYMLFQFWTTKLIPVPINEISILNFPIYSTKLMIEENDINANSLNRFIKLLIFDRKYFYKATELLPFFNKENNYKFVFYPHVVLAFDKTPLKLFYQPLDDTSVKLSF